MRAENAGGQPFKGTKPTTASPIFVHLYLYSWVLRVVAISQPASAILLHVRYRCWLARWASRSTNRQWKGQPSFSRQRTSLPPTHARPSVHRNLHNSGRKCQYTESMMIRYLGEDARLPPCDLEDSVESSFPETNETNNESGKAHTQRIWTASKRPPPLPDRILVASYVSAGRWCQSSVCYFHSEPFCFATEN